MSAAFCASADGHKLPVLIIVPRKTDIPSFTPPENVIVHYKSSTTFDEQVLTNEFFGRIFEPHTKRYDIEPSYLFLDSAPCHKTKLVNDTAKDAKIRLKTIPHRMTSILQPADVCWFASVRKQIQAKWTNWYIEDNHSFTKAGNMKSSGYVQLISWISQVWEEFNIQYAHRLFHEPNFLRTEAKVRQDPCRLVSFRYKILSRRYASHFCRLIITEKNLDSGQARPLEVLSNF